MGDPVADRLAMALRAAHLGPWEWDARTDAVTLSERATEILGVTPGFAVTWTEMLAYLDPLDRDRVRDAVIRAVTERSDYQVEYRAVAPDGRRLWVAATGRAVYAEDGMPLGMSGLLQDITARKQVEQDLAERAEALAQADRHKDEFLAMLAHELRNPLAAVSSAIDLLGLTKPGDPKFERALQIARRQVDHQRQLVDDLLDVSRIARGKISLTPAPLDLAAVARDAADDHRARIVAATVRLEVEVPADEVWIDGDRVRLAQVIGNLLDNARKFTPAGGEIRLRLTTAEDRALLAVIDTGIGLEAGAMPTLFSPFTQVARTLARSQGGLGLGLAVVRGIVELHPGGTVTVHSAGLGAGSTFQLAFPLRAR